MLHGLAVPGSYTRSYFSRYSEDALDLRDALSSFVASIKLRLDELCR